MNEYYVYVYIDPRNFEGFYFGKGRGSRKDAHLTDSSDNKKVERIADIHAAGLDPIIRVIAKNLSEHDAFLVEKTLLWKLGRQLTNIASGHYADKFRPPDKLHLKLPGFDYQNRIHLLNVGDGIHRDWEDYREFGFVSAGQGLKYRDAICGLEVGDIIASYSNGHGYVGIGQITTRAKPIREVVINGVLLLDLPLRCPNMRDNYESNEKSEYVCLVNWKTTVSRQNGKWKKNTGLFSTQLVRASLDNQKATLDFLESEFNIKLTELII